jgi:hypothetical protein
MSCSRLASVGRGSPFRANGQIIPRKTKPNQIEPNKIAWIYLVLFVRIGTFQWVTANPNKKSFPRVTLCLKYYMCFVSFATPPRAASTETLNRPAERAIAHILTFEKKMHQNFSAGKARGVRRGTSGTPTARDSCRNSYSPVVARAVPKLFRHSDPPSVTLLLRKPNAPASSSSPSATFVAPGELGRELFLGGPP